MYLPKMRDNTMSSRTYDRAAPFQMIKLGDAEAVSDIGRLHDETLAWIAVNLKPRSGQDEINSCSLFCASDFTHRVVVHEDPRVVDDLRQISEWCSEAELDWVMFRQL